jgi:hypothetical protein
MIPATAALNQESPILALRVRLSAIERQLYGGEAANGYQIGNGGSPPT